MEFFLGLFILCLLIVVVVNVHMEYRQKRLRSPAAVPCNDFVPSSASLNGHPMPAEERIIGLSAKVMEDGMHLEFYLPPNQRGTTSPITSLVSTRQHEENGTIYHMTTASGSTYVVSMCDDTAKQVLSSFYAWRKANGQPQPAGA